ncbi:MAG TPA: alpha/beta hydrolase [Rhodocyclaceae bacterium]|jgi:pimeloyl-ACP methyl ester carboxylesterase|nr:alpha/beta hydrolase [Rhodocyclaceae bacterium]
MKNYRNEFIEVGNPDNKRRIHVRIWGESDAPKLFMLHGWGDVSATFQFVVDAFKHDWQVIAPDWRGFGLSSWNGGPYWYPDYLVDLEGVLDHYAANEQIDIVGHSLGGNVLCLYAGARPQRFRRIATLEGFGLPETSADDAAQNYAAWLDEVREPTRFRDYADFSELAARLHKDNPRLLPERADYMARHLGQKRLDGRIEMAIDPCHRWRSPFRYRLDEAKACWREITAPVLWVAAQDSFVMKRFDGKEAEYAARKACFRDLREVVLPSCGHNMHHEYPEKVAELLEEFFSPL